MLNAAIILAFSSSLVLRRVLLVSCSTAPSCIIIKGIAILGVWQSDVRDHVVCRNFLTVGSPDCVAYCRVFLPGLGFPSSHPLSPGNQYLLQALDVVLFCMRSCEKINGGITSPLLMTTSMTNDSEKVLSILQIIAQSAGTLEYTDCFSAEG